MTVDQQEIEAELTSQITGDMGILQVKVFAAKGALPVENAKVTVTEFAKSGRNLVGFLQTDANGLTAEISLPSPPMSASQNPLEQGFNQYFVDIFKEGFNPQIDVPVEIFPQNQTILPINLQVADTK